MTAVFLVRDSLGREHYQEQVIDSLVTPREATDTFNSILDSNSTDGSSATEDEIEYARRLGR